LEGILDQMLVQASQLLGAKAAAIYRLQEPDGIMRITAAHSLEPEAAAVVIPAAWGAIGRAVIQRRPTAAMLDIVARPGARESRENAQQPANWEQLTKHYTAALVAPVIIRDDVYGALVLYQHSDYRFSDADLQLVGTFGDHAALVIENARLFVVARDKAALDERQCLGRDLHDSVTQALYVMKLYAEAVARRLAAGDTATASDYLRELRGAAQEALQEMRVLIFKLRPPILEQEGLALAIQSRLEAVEGRSGLETDFSVDGGYPPAAAVEQALYRVTQEALNNVLKHAQARRISVSLQQQPDRTLLTIVDDGIGFDPAAAIAQSGLGLRGMEERVAQLGGRLTIESGAGMGTVVRVEVKS
jgi:signal transduction histidine kinase